MDRFISKELSVTDIARRLQVSNNTLYRAFEHTVGESPARFFRVMRLAHGHWSLHHTSMSIAQVAHVYKFSDASHFTRMHRLCGMAHARPGASLGEDGRQPPGDCQGAAATAVWGACSSSTDERAASIFH